MRVTSAFQAIRSFGRSRSPIQISRSVADQISSRECRNWKLPAIWRPLRKPRSAIRSSSMATCGSSISTPSSPGSEKSVSAASSDRLASGGSSGAHCTREGRDSAAAAIDSSVPPRQ